MTRQFHKMHGLGNDFVILDAREEPITLRTPYARAIADRRTGIGCDQLIVLERSQVADLKMRIWNADGGEVESCGNATRCVVALTGAERIETAGGVLTGQSVGALVEVALPAPRFGWESVPIAFATDTQPLAMAWGPLEAPWALNVGNPHLVFFVADHRVALDELGPQIEHDPAFPERINVNLAVVERDRIALRTWERGAGLTRACGTGAAASAVAAIAAGKARGPVIVTMPGGELTIDWSPGTPITMRGPATHVFSGTIDLATLGR